MNQNRPGNLTRRRFASQALTGMTSLCFAPRLIAAQKTKTQLMAGAAETVVTPTARGTFLIGPMDLSSGVHDELHARAVVFADGEKRLALVTIDYLGFDFPYNDVLVAAIAEKSGIPAAHIMINGSHNHNAPLTIPWGPWEKNKDKPWHKTLPGKLADIVQQAAGDLKPARLRYHREPTQIGINRRLPTAEGIIMAPNPHGVVLPWVDVLSVETAQGRPLAVLFSHAAHPVIVHAASTLITADYPGFAVQTLRQSLGQDAVYLFAQGCGANINGFPLQGGIDAAAAAGRDLGRAVGRAVEMKPDVLAAGSFQALDREVTLPLRSPPPVAECQELVAQEDDPAGKERLTELLAIAEAGRPQTLPFPMRAFRLSDELCLVGLPHEVFAEYHLFVDEVSPFAHNMVFGYTNGCECYVGMETDYRLGDRGGYETSPLGAPLMYHRRLAPVPECEQQIKSALQSVLTELKSL